MVARNLVVAGVLLTVLVARDLVAALPPLLRFAGHESSAVIVGLDALRFAGDLP
ncbi:hypothetical protein [Streptomyces sp. 4N124]|uniref:hypothetical protein n=1 Tax=Streptomyces sp. 4N124 TaxID=3457420 RepID=UPI003FD31547